MSVRLFCRFEVQLQYGSIGWSVGATLGYAVGRPKTRMLSLIGDGSFQVTAQVYQETHQPTLLCNSNSSSLNLHVATLMLSTFARTLGCKGHCVHSGQTAL